MIETTTIRCTPARWPTSCRFRAAAVTNAVAASSSGEGQREVVDAFFAAARDRDFDTLVALLDPDVVLRADGGAAEGASRELRGAQAVARGAFAAAQLGRTLRPALVNGAAGVVVFERGRPVSVMGFTVAGGKIVEIDVLADPERLSRLDLSALND
jgi:ketosteroid isomerase-like protein